ncbi:MAG: hypothetical protein ACJASL_000984 [Paraglaciecola sp.]|jgi:short-subunit dehydrogenase
MKTIYKHNQQQCSLGSVATSRIGQASAKELGKHNKPMVLIADNAAKLKLHGINVSIAATDFTDNNLSSQINFKKTLFKYFQAKFVARYSLRKMTKISSIIPALIKKCIFYSDKYIQPRRFNSFVFGQVLKTEQAQY